MSNDTNISYPLKVWLTSLLLASLLFGIATFLGTEFGKFDIGIFELILFVFFYSLLFSLPTFLVYFLLYRKLTFTSNFKKKAFFSMIAIAGMALTIFILFGSGGYNVHQDFSGISFSIIYSVSILISSFLYRLK